MKKLGLLVFVLILCLSLIAALPACGKVPAAAEENVTEETTHPTDAVIPESVGPKDDHI